MIRKLLDVEGPVVDFLEKCGQLIVLSALWLLCCIPVVTLCASSAALYDGVFQTVRKQEGNAIKTFFSSIKRNSAGYCADGDIASGFWRLVVGFCRCFPQGTPNGNFSCADDSYLPYCGVCPCGHGAVSVWCWRCIEALLCAFFAVYACLFAACAGYGSFDGAANLCVPHEHDFDSPRRVVLVRLFFAGKGSKPLQWKEMKLDRRKRALDYGKQDEI